MNVYVRDGTTMTGGELLATGEENIGSSFTNAKLLVRVDIYWEDDYGPNYQFDSEHFIVLELENDGENAINLKVLRSKTNDALKVNETVQNYLIEQKNNFPKSLNVEQFGTVANLISDLSLIHI